MGTSTVSGPFRSANGFQQLDENGVWVPVSGGGGGGGGGPAIEIDLNLSNAYSWDKYSYSPTGPTAGYIIDVPNTLEIGQFMRVYTYGTRSGLSLGGSNPSPSEMAWAFRLPNPDPYGAIPPPAGTDYTTWFGSVMQMGAITVQISGAGSAALSPRIRQVRNDPLSTSGPNMYPIYIYGYTQAPGYFDIMRGGNQDWLYESTIWATYGIVTPVNYGYQSSTGLEQLTTYPAQSYYS